MHLEANEYSISISMHEMCMKSWKLWTEIICYLHTPTLLIGYLNKKFYTGQYRDVSNKTFTQNFIKKPTEYRKIILTLIMYKSTWL
jgi:hypothetical protein